MAPGCRRRKDDPAVHGLWQDDPSFLSLRRSEFKAVVMQEWDILRWGSDPLQRRFATTVVRYSTVN